MTAGRGKDGRGFGARRPYHPLSGGIASGCLFGRLLHQQIRRLRQIICSICRGWNQTAAVSSGEVRTNQKSNKRSRKHQKENRGQRPGCVSLRAPAHPSQPLLAHCSLINDGDLDKI